MLPLVTITGTARSAKNGSRSTVVAPAFAEAFASAVAVREFIRRAAAGWCFAWCYGFDLHGVSPVVDMANLRPVAGHVKNYLANVAMPCHIEL